MTILDNLQNYVFSHNNTYWRCEKMGNVYYIIFCTKGGKITNPPKTYWFTSVNPAEDLRKMMLFNPTRISAPINDPSVCYKIQQLENRFKERQAKHAQAQ